MTNILEMLIYITSIFSGNLMIEAPAAPAPMIEAPIIQEGPSVGGPVFNGLRGGVAAR